MNKELWEKIAQFDLDGSSLEYGFATRLAKENYWTRNFTREAIVEYKKFMYLAATSEFMVSPSGVVDTVWHQHLIFTQSYQDFCNLIGKQVQHVPSTHTREDFQKFKQAKERTTTLYESVFGAQPASIWHYSDMYESLNLAKAKLKLRTFIIIGILAFTVLFSPMYLLLKPMVTGIENPFFLFCLVGIAAVTFMLLELFNSIRLKQITQGFDKQSFVYHLEPAELIYLKTQKLSNVIHGSVNELVINGSIDVHSDNTMSLTRNTIEKSNEAIQIEAALSSLERTHYPALLKQLANKPIFKNVSGSMDAFKKYFNKSQKFGRLFYMNFGILALLQMLALTRLVTGILRDKPVTYIAITSVGLTIAIIVYLNRLSKMACTKTIPALYKEEILTRQHISENRQWRYFINGSSVLTATFIPLVSYVDKNNQSGSSCGTSCGSSCGSSCGGCGGCGGD